MKHWTDETAQLVDRVLEPTDIELTDEMRRQLVRYAEWLTSEATIAGGIGPREAERLWERHIADALAYTIVADARPERFLDVGTGVGLPGLVLAMVWPASDATLIDRSGRRVDLVRRAARVCGVDNVEVRHASHREVVGTWPLVVSRATLPANEVAGELQALLTEDGRAVVGIHRGTEPALPAPSPAVEVVTIPQLILDPPAWFLKIHARG